MSRGKYTSAMDIWSCGCVFGELLQVRGKGGEVEKGMGREGRGKEDWFGGFYISVSLECRCR